MGKQPKSDFPFLPSAKKSPFFRNERRKNAVVSQGKRNHNISDARPDMEFMSCLAVARVARGRANFGMNCLSHAVGKNNLQEDTRQVSLMYYYETQGRGQPLTSELMSSKTESASLMIPSMSSPTVGMS